MMASSPSFADSSQSVSTNEDTAKAITLAATDADSDPLTYTAAAAVNGTVAVSGAVVTYTPNANFNGTDSFVVTASDGRGGTATQTVNVTIAAVNDAPTFLNGLGQRLSAVIVTPGINEDASAIEPLSGQDVDGDTLTYAISSAALRGTTVFSGNNVIYTPNDNFNGTDSFVVTASDGRGGTATQTVNVTIAAVNDAPTFLNGLGQRLSAVIVTPGINEDASAIEPLSGQDVDGDTLTYAISSAALRGTTVFSGNCPSSGHLAQIAA